jgi:hypothetical protein
VAKVVDDGDFLHKLVSSFATSTYAAFLAKSAPHLRSCSIAVADTVHSCTYKYLPKGIQGFFVIFMAIWACDKPIFIERGALKLFHAVHDQAWPSGRLVIWACPSTSGQYRDDGCVFHIACFQVWHTYGKIAGICVGTCVLAGGEDPFFRRPMKRRYSCCARALQ